jgi:mannose-1-phosphate guanylyltransferase
MEKVDDLTVIPIDVGWNDIGGWAQVAGLHTADPQGNVVVGLPPDGYIQAGSSGTLVFSTTGRLVATAEIEDLIIVDTEDALLVVPKRDAQRVRDLAEELKRRRAGGA